MDRELNKQLIISTTYRNNGTKSYLIRNPNSEGIKVVETRPGRDGMGKDDWLEDALNWAYEQGERAEYKSWIDGGFADER